MKKLSYLLSMLIIIIGIGTSNAQNYDIGVSNIVNYNNPDNPHRIGRGLSFVPQIRIYNYGSETLPQGSTIPVYIDMDFQVFDFNLSLDVSLNPGDSVTTFVMVGGEPFYVMVPSIQPTNNNITAWTDFPGDIDNTNDDFTVNFKAYNTNRDVGISNIFEPEENIIVQPGEKVEIKFEFKNFDDTTLGYMQELPVRAFINQNDVFFFNFKDDVITIEDINGLPSTGTLELAFSEEYEMPVNGGSYKLCVQTLWNLDFNANNNTYCIDFEVPVVYNIDVGISNVRNLTPPHEHKIGTGLIWIPQFQLKNFGSQPINSGTQIPFYFKITHDELTLPETQLNITLNNTLQPDSTYNFFVILNNVIVGNVFPAGTAPDKIEVCGRTDYAADENKDNDNSCIDFIIYEGQRDVGVVAITQPTAGGTINREPPPQVAFTFRNYGDTALTRYQTIPFVVRLTGAPDVNFNYTFPGNSQGLAPGQNLPFPLQGDYNANPNLQPGPGQLCVATIWSIDVNPANNESCVNVNIDYGLSAEKLTKGDLEVVVYPNPANDIANINYMLENKNYINIQLFDIHGRVIKQLTDEVQEPGQYNVTINTAELTNGLYMYSIQVGNDKVSGRLMVNN